MVCEAVENPIAQRSAQHRCRTSLPAYNILVEILDTVKLGLRSLLFRFRVVLTVKVIVVVE